jgi:hypothetical protein
MENNNCNGSGPHAPGEVRLMPYGGGANDILCRVCWQRALADRRERNRTLEDFAQFKIPAWETAQVYDTRPVRTCQTHGMMHADATDCPKCGDELIF